VSHPTPHLRSGNAPGAPGGPAGPAGPEEPISTADRLLSTAAKLFREKGYASATTRELAQLLGIQKASLYHHIETKEDVLHALCMESLSRITADVRAVRDAAPPETRLKAMIEAHAQSALRDRDMHSTMLIELRSLSDNRRAEVVERRDAYEQMLRGTIRADQDAGRLRSDVDEKYLALALLNLLNWTIFWFDPRGDVDADSVGSLLGRIYLEGIRASD
jgi:AcrR family transcriptional regulator